MNRLEYRRLNVCNPETYCKDDVQLKTQRFLRSILY